MKFCNILLKFIFNVFIKCNKSIFSRPADFKPRASKDQIMK